MACLEAQLRTLDSWLASTPADQHARLDFDVILRAAQVHQAARDSDMLLEAVLWDLSRDTPRPESIASVFVQAYRAALAGRVYVNPASDTINVERGRSYTASEVLDILPDVDALLTTHLGSHFQRVYAHVKPFPLLRLPAELRLHVYAQRLPREPHLSLFDQPNRAYKPPRLDLTILRTCHQLHDEVTKYLYRDRTLFVKAVTGGKDMVSSAHITQNYESVAAMAPTTRLYFKTLEIQVDYQASRDVCGPRFPHALPSYDPFADTFKLLPALETVVVSFPPHGPNPSTKYRYAKRKEPVAWLIEHIPDSLQLRWDFTHWHDEAGEQMVADRMASRGGLQHGASVSWDIHYVQPAMRIRFAN
ncbi:hypothetical protein BDV95DRAFT_8308 [Massariosphaeria phaeospora]|uniref:F-box domain-containing protein n=1 Tax=Massariosphaeria phaeospora TaxID=100035 RepID=A0A7C8IR23_9PLEO|nr:hypothetical protein BDV95DRAFT_8308 [Massariosphaeria phaeospora]